MGYTGAHALLASHRGRLPLVTSYYGKDVAMGTSEGGGPTLQYAHYALLRRRLFAKGDRFLALSAHMKRALVGQGCPEHKIRIVRVGVDIQRFSVHRAPRTGPCRVLMIGRDVEKKGFDDGMHAVARAKDRGASLTLSILGTSQPSSTQLRLARDLDLPVRWPDPASDVPSELARADILLAPSRTTAGGDQEGTPTVICEAGAAALPVVSTRHAGIPEQIDEDVTGLLAPERDVDRLAAHLARLCDDVALRKRMGQAAREKISAEYSIEAHADELIKVYAELLA